MKISIVKRCAAVVILGLLSVLPSDTLKTSDAGLKLIMDYEGCQLNAYQCSANVWTNGYGHTVGVTPNSEVTHEQVVGNLVSDVQSAEAVVDRWVTVPLEQHQFDAFVSFVFNVGAGNFQRSTLLKKLNAENYTGACNELTRWVYADGKRLQGLVRRRNAEREVCLNVHPL
ncbi:lysozyme [Photobacterium alginatilyticum]|uniref:Lysozyme n=1 Tax=Photobacterium alginatilyticum TaxID=1775171 RepID=A0ABW9YNP8_9GAMM|nr:lysozyme [Photobacterium alginatilyticum]NBI54664.1 lysozyme [Photobacterium alginatilyticum]